MVSMSCLVPRPIAGGLPRLFKWKHVALLAFVRLPGRATKILRCHLRVFFPSPSHEKVCPSQLCDLQAEAALEVFGLSTALCELKVCPLCRVKGCLRHRSLPCPFAFRAGPGQGRGNLPLITTFSHELSPTHYFFLPRCSAFWGTLLRCFALPSVCNQGCVFQTRHLENNWHTSVVALRNGSRCTHREEYPIKSVLKGG